MIVFERGVDCLAPVILPRSNRTTDSCVSPLRKTYLVYDFTNQKYHDISLNRTSAENNTFVDHYEFHFHFAL